MGLDIRIKAEPNERFDPQSVYDEIDLSGRGYRNLVFDIVGITDKDYGNDVSISRKKAIEVVEYLVESGTERAAETLALWIVLNLDITFEADW